MESRNVAAARGVIEGFTSGDVEGATRRFAVDGALISPTGGGTIRGHEALRAHMHRSLAIFGEWTIHNLEFIDAGDVVVALMTAESTNIGPIGDTPATGKRFSLKFCEVYRFNAAGEVVTDEAFYDQMAIYRQLGLA